jgi:hypothetical protein
MDRQFTRAIITRATAIASHSPLHVSVEDRVQAIQAANERITTSIRSGDRRSAEADAAIILSNVVAAFGVMAVAL